MMNRTRQHLLTAVCSGAQLASFTLTLLGIVSLIVGIFVMPKLGLSEPQFYVGLLGLVAFMVLCFGAGQLAVIQNRLAVQNHPASSLK
jgi:hypothetical protein